MASTIQFLEEVSYFLVYQGSRSNREKIPGPFGMYFQYKQSGFYGFTLKLVVFRSEHKSAKKKQGLEKLKAQPSQYYPLLFCHIFYDFICAIDNFRFVLIKEMMCPSHRKNRTISKYLAIFQYFKTFLLCLNLFYDITS